MRNQFEATDFGCRKRLKRNFEQKTVTLQTFDANWNRDITKCWTEAPDGPFRNGSSVGGNRSTLPFRLSMHRSAATTRHKHFRNLKLVIETLAVHWRQRFVSGGRVASRGLHYNASARNSPMIAGGRSDAYNNRSRQFKIKE